MGLLSRVPVAPLCIITLIVGVLGICLVVSHFERPVNPRQLHSIRSGGQVLSSQHIDVNPAIKGNVFLASRTAIRATNRAYNFRAIVDVLLQPPKSADYTFHKELYVRKGKATSLQFARSLGGEISAEGIDPEGNGNDEPDVWSDDQEEATTRTELEDILLVNLPLLVFFAIIFSAVEITAMLARRGRDWMLQTELWKLKETAFRAQVAKESQVSTFRPYLASAFAFGIFCTVASSIDIFGKCYWNWPCWFDLDCNIRILAPAVLECSSEVLFPAAILTVLLVLALLASIWCGLAS